MRQASGKRIADADRALIYTGLGRSLSAGLPPDRALEACGDLVDHAANRSLRIAAKAVREGKSLLQTLSAQGLTNPLDRAVLECAEQSGAIDSALQALGRSYEARHLRQHKLKGQLLLPAVTLLFAILLGPLPALVSGRITLMSYMGRAAIIIVGVCIAFMLVRALVRQFRAHGWPAFVTRTALGTPVLGTALSFERRAGFYETLALMLGAGLAAHQAIQLVHRAERDALRKGQLSVVTAALTGGSTVADALDQANLIKREFDLPILSAGEQAGRLQQSLESLAKDCQREAGDWQRLIGQWIPVLVYAAVCAYVAMGFF